MLPFSWPVTESGYAWEDNGMEPVLVAQRPWPTRRDEPTVQNSALFRTFAGLVPEPDAVLKFVARYGHLGEFVWVRGAKFDPARAGETDVLNASLLARTALEPARLGRERPESLSFWVVQIEGMRAAHEVWDEIRAGRSDPDRMGQVAEAIDRGCRGRVECRFEYDRRNRTSEWSKIPLDLLGAIWLQFADAVAGDKQVRQCPVCSDWFVVAPGRARTDKQHCSLRCRQKAYESRKDLAIKLYAQNGSVEETASQLDWDAEVVGEWIKKWIKKTKPAKNTKPADGDSDDAGTKPTRAGLDL